MENANPVVAGLIKLQEDRAHHTRYAAYYRDMYDSTGLEMDRNEALYHQGRAANIHDYIEHLRDKATA